MLSGRLLITKKISKNLQSSFDSDTIQDGISGFIRWIAIIYNNAGTTSLHFQNLDSK